MRLDGPCIADASACAPTAAPSSSEPSGLANQDRVHRCGSVSCPSLAAALPFKPSSVNPLVTIGHLGLRQPKAFSASLWLSFCGHHSIPLPPSSGRRHLILIGPVACSLRSRFKSIGSSGMLVSPSSLVGCLLNENGPFIETAAKSVGGCSRSKFKLRGNSAPAK